jgi:hypothetical protein
MAINLPANTGASLAVGQQVIADVSGDMMKWEFRVPDNYLLIGYKLT